MRKDFAVWAGLVAGLLTLALAGCGRGGGVAGPDTPSDAQAGSGAAGAPGVGQGVAQVAPPAYMNGYFATARSAGAWEAGSTTIVVPSWGDDAEAAARVLVERGAFALVSAHHCFGAARAGWGECWERTRAWMAPIERTGRLLGVYVVDEPFHNGISREGVEAAVGMVRGAGYRTMIAETYDRYAVGRWVPPVDWFGLTAYYTKPEWVADRYLEERRLNVAFVSSAGEDTRLGRAGCFRWSLDLGAARRPSAPVRLP